MIISFTINIPWKLTMFVLNPWSLVITIDINYHTAVSFMSWTIFTFRNRNKTGRMVLDYTSSVEHSTNTAKLWDDQSFSTHLFGHRFRGNSLPTASYISTWIIFQFSFDFLKTVPFLLDAQIKMKKEGRSNGHDERRSFRWLFLTLNVHIHKT
jgi:hypothetical protein